MDDLTKPDDQSQHGAANSTDQAAHLQSQLPLSPGGALLFASLPLGLGAYIGYRRALHESLSSSSSISSAAAAASSISNGGNNNIHGIQGGKSIFGQLMHPEPPISPSGIRLPPQPNPLSSSSTMMTPTTIATTTATPPPILAARALAIGSLLSLSGTALLISGIFYMSGCQSVEELISTVQHWAPTKLQHVENSLGNWLGISSIGKERRAAKLEYERDVRGMTEEEELEYVKKKYGGEMNWDDE